MLSIIVCSKYSTLDKNFIANVAQTTGVPYEIVHIDNSKGHYSIFEAYNKGIAQSKYPTLCLVHEDVLFTTQNWGVKVIEHLNEPQTGLIGIAGSAHASRVPFTWSYSGTYYQWTYNNGKAKRLIKGPQIIKDIKNGVVFLDGVFLCMRKEITEKIHFDESLKGFHGYDLDISLQSYNAGYNNYMVSDIMIEHLSSGNKNRRYYQNLLTVYRKWENILPIDVSKTLSQATITAMETAKLKVLLTKLAKRAFEFDEIKDVWQYYLPCTNFANRQTKATCFFLKIKLIRMFYFFGKLYYK